VLANVAHQRFELRDFFSSFTRDLANCAPRRDYGLPAKIAGSCYLRTRMPIVSSGWAPFPRAPPAAFAKARSQQEGARLGGGEAQRLPLLQCSGSSSASAADDDEPLITDGSAAPSRPTSWAPAPPQVASICAGRCVASSVFETEVQVAQRG
jgi:hypothetical protein